MKPKKTLKQKIKESNDTEVQVLADELDTFTELDILARSKGGEILVGTMMKDIVSDIEAICHSSDKFTLQEFIAYSSRIKEKLNLVRVLKRSEKNKKFISEEIAEILSDSLL